MTVRQTTRVPKHLHTWLADRAKANHRSLNAELISILSIEAAKGAISCTPGRLQPDTE